MSPATDRRSRSRSGGVVAVLGTPAGPRSGCGCRSRTRAGRGSDSRPSWRPRLPGTGACQRCDEIELPGSCYGDGGRVLPTCSLSYTPTSDREDWYVSRRPVPAARVIVAVHSVVIADGRGSTVHLHVRASSSPIAGYRESGDEGQGDETHDQPERSGGRVIRLRRPTVPWMTCAIVRGRVTASHGRCPRPSVLSVGALAHSSGSGGPSLDGVSAERTDSQEPVGWTGCTSGPRA